MDTGLENRFTTYIVITSSLTIKRFLTTFLLAVILLCGNSFIGLRLLKVTTHTADVGDLINQYHCKDSPLCIIYFCTKGQPLVELNTAMQTTEILIIIGMLGN